MTFWAISMFFTIFSAQVLIDSRNWQTVSVKGQIVSILGFFDPTISVATIQQLEGMKTAHGLLSFQRISMKLKTGPSHTPLVGVK